MSDGVDARAAIEQACGEAIERIEPLADGQLGPVLAVHARSGRSLVVKLDPARTGRLAIEGRMLRFLAARASIDVPRFVGSAPGALAMERIKSDGARSPEGEAAIARQLVALHAIESGTYGLDWDTTIGPLDQSNAPSNDWTSFFVEHRLTQMTRACRDAGHLSTPLARRLDALAQRVPALIGEPAAPGLIHGDLWGGNVLFDGGRFVGVIDPALYFADPEIEIAYTTMFGTFSERFYDVYAKARPIRDGFWERRVHLYNLYPTLVHVRIYGAPYASGVERALAALGA